MMATPAFDPKRLVPPASLSIVVYLSIIAISIMTMINPAQASGALQLGTKWCILPFQNQFPICGYATPAIACDAYTGSVSTQIPASGYPIGTRYHCISATGSSPGDTFIKYSCPVNSTGSGGSCTCNDPYVPDSTGTSCVLEQYTISEPQDQTQLPDVEPGSSREVTARVTSQTGQPKEGAVVRFHLDVDPTSGGHDHGETGGHNKTYERRPRGTIVGSNCVPESGDATLDTYDCTTGLEGYVSFNFNAPDASGTHTFTATCVSQGCSGSRTAKVNVKVDGLWPIPDSAYYALTEDGSSKVIGSTADHTSNHYLTNAAALKLWRLASDFYDYQIRNGVTSPTLLHLNDASLKWGGVFDIDADWVPDHEEHRRGTVIDVRANSKPGAIPPEYFAAFMDMSVNLKVDPHFEGGSTNQHFHLRLLKRKE
jgi:hypothetical protein